MNFSSYKAGDKENIKAPLLSLIYCQFEGDSHTNGHHSPIIFPNYVFAITKVLFFPSHRL